MSVHFIRRFPMYYLRAKLFATTVRYLWTEYLRLHPSCASDAGNFAGKTNEIPSAKTILIAMCLTVSILTSIPVLSAVVPPGSASVPKDRGGQPQIEMQLRMNSS